MQMRMGAVYPWQTTAYLLIFSFLKVENSFTTRHVAIEASSALLEALIASLLPACGPTKEATFQSAIRLLIAVGLLVACADDEWATTPSCVSMGARNTLLQVHAFVARCTRRVFLTLGILTFSWQGDRPIMASS